MSDLWPFIKLYRRHLGLLSLGILLAIVTLLASLSLLSLSGWFITSTAIAGLTLATAQTFNFFTPGAGVRGFSIARTAARYGERLVSHDATFRLLSWLRVWFFSKLIPVSQEQLGQYRKAELLDRLVADIDALDQLYLRMISPLLSALVVTGLLTLFLSLFSTTLAMVVFLVMTGWILSMPLLFYRLGRNTGESMGVRQGRLRQVVLDYLQGMAEQQIYGCDRSTRETIGEAERQLNRDQGKMAALEGLGSAFFVAGSGFAALLILYLGSGELASGQVSGPVMVMMVFAMLAGFEALMPLPGAFQFLSHTRHAAARLKEVVHRPVVHFPENNGCQPEDGEVVFHQVSSGYGISENQYGVEESQVIDQLSLTIPSGHHVAIVGKTGCGKSTLIKLLSRGLDAYQGKVLIGGQRVERLTESTLYNTLTFVPQKTHVFSATLRDNLKLAAPDAGAEQLLEVVRVTGLDTLAAVQQGESEGNSLDLWIGQGGVSLSGGEQRRLAIARALLKPAPILVMDEPGEGLDVISENTLLEEVLNRFRSRTVIMITHKTAMLKRMDRVYRMVDGRLAQL